MLFTDLCFAEVLYFTDSSNVNLQSEIKKQPSLQNSDSLSIFLINHGYLDATVIKRNDTMHISFNQQYYLHNIMLKSKQTNTTQVDKIFTKKTISNEIDKLLQVEKINGYQFATITIDSSTIDAYNVNFFCSMQEGPQLYFDSLKFEGLTKTDNFLLSKYFNITDSIITPDLLEAIENDAYTIPFVRFTPPIKQELKQGYQTANLIVPFTEKENLLFEGGAGYLSESDLFIWNISLQFQNLFGNGRQVSFISQKINADNQHLKFLYTQPIFLLGVGSAQVGVQTRDYRNQFFEFLIHSALKTYYKRKINISFLGQYKSVEQDMSQSYHSAELAIAISNRTPMSLSITTNSFYYDWKLSYGNRKYNEDTLFVAPSQNSFNESRIEINTKLYTYIKQNFFLFTNMTFQSFQTAEKLPPFAELYLVGGTESIRGFKDEQFPSIRNLTATIEPQYHFGSGNLFLFYDGGYIFNRFASETTEFIETTIFRYGYGGGISILNSNNSLKVSFGWNKNLTFDNPRISIQLKTRL